MGSKDNFGFWLELRADAAPGHLHSVRLETAIAAIPRALTVPGDITPLGCDCLTRICPVADIVVLGQYETRGFYGHSTPHIDIDAQGEFREQGQ
jgi:hypothetical protein